MGMEEPPFHLESHQNRWKNRASGGKLTAWACPGSWGANRCEALMNRDPPARGAGAFPA